MDDFFIRFLLVVFYCASDPSKLGPSVLMVGDSNVGTGLVAGLTRSASLRENPWQLTPVSVSGSGIKHQAFWLPHLRARIEATHPNLVILNLGANDAGAPDFPERWVDLPSQALELLREIPSTSKMIVVGVPPDMSPGGVPLDGQVGWLNLFVWPYALDEWGGEYRFVLPPPGCLGEDRLHYTDEGGRVVAGMVYNAAQELLQEVEHGS